MEFIVYVAPALVHAPALVNVIANPELALATTVKLLLLVAVAGAGTVTVIVWLAWFTTCPPLNVPVLPLWLLSPLYVPVIMLFPSGRLEVAQVAIPGLPVVTVVVPQPVSAAPQHRAPHVAAIAFPLASFNSPYSPLIVAVNVTACPYPEGF